MKQSVRMSGRGAGFETLWQDVRFALRMLLKTPGFTAMIVVTLALGIGANTAIFTLVDAELLQSLPVSHAEQLTVFEWSAHAFPITSGMYNSGDCWTTPSAGSTSGCYLSFPIFTAMINRDDLFANVTAFAGPANLDLAGNGQATIATGELVSGSYFETLGVRPAMGRVLVPSDDQKGASPVAVLDYAYWLSAFNANPSVVGKTIRLNNVLFAIVGVADPAFTRLTPGRSVNVYIPLTEGKALGLAWAADEQDNASWWLTVVGRLRPGVTKMKAAAAVSLQFRNETTHGAMPAWQVTDGPRIELVPALEGLVGFRAFLSEPLHLLMAAVTFVLLIACANVAGLVLARSSYRQREIAVRLALGATRWRVIRQVLTESLLLSLSGAALGILLAYAGASVLAAFMSANTNWGLQINVRPDANILLFTAAIAVITGVVFGMTPAVKGARTQAATEFRKSTIAGGTSTSHIGGRRLGLGGTLVVVQVCLSIVMLTGAGLMLRTLGKIRNIDAGFDTKNLLLMWIDPTLAGYDKARVGSYYENLQQRLGALPGVLSASYSSDAMLDGGLRISEIKIDGESNKQAVESQILMVGPQYFDTMRIPVLRGRSLGLADIRSDLPVALVNAAFVGKFLNGLDPIGLHFGSSDTQGRTIVGVVRNTKYDSLMTEDKPTVYLPLTDGAAVFAIKTDTPPAALIPAVRKVVHDLDEDVPVMHVQTQSAAIDQQLFNQRLLVRLLGGFAGLGAVLACVGLYGLLSYEAATRMREIGVRTALGAQRSNILWLFLRRGLMVVVLGSAVGVGSAALATRLLTSMLYGIKPLDPVTFIAVPILLCGIGLLACLPPTLRAMRIDPVVALRCE